ncbi:MAG: single-stranded DNA-binding protein [Cyanobacteria bacterium P01_H01_bin.15]
MNSCVLMATVASAPELRYTQDNQTPVTHLLVELPGLRPDDPVSSLRLVGWGNLAQEIDQSFSPGDRVIVSGRLTMNTVDRPEGFKEKRAELTVSQIYAVDSATTAPESSSSTLEKPTASMPNVNEPTEVATPNLDDIPF